MNATLAHWYQMATSLTFWEQLLDSFQNFGPLVPIALAALESLIPALPLVAIVLVNVAAHGVVLGFLYSWIGTSIGCAIVFCFFRVVCKDLFARWAKRSEKVRRAREWVNGFDPTALFLLAILPFTPSSFLNFAFGVSDFDARTYLWTMVRAKLIMIALLALMGQSFVEALDNPWFILLGIGMAAALYYLSKQIGKKHNL